MCALRRAKVTSSGSSPLSARPVSSFFQVNFDTLPQARTVQVTSIRFLNNNDFCRHPGPDTGRPAPLPSSYTNGQQNHTCGCAPTSSRQLAGEKGQARQGFTRIACSERCRRRASNTCAKRASSNAEAAVSRLPGRARSLKHRSP
jgi:hypothetical protein